MFFPYTRCDENLVDSGPGTEVGDFEVATGIKYQDVPVRTRHGSGVRGISHRTGLKFRASPPSFNKIL